VARLSVNVSSDGLVAKLRASTGPPAGAKEVAAALTKSGIVHGIDTAAIDAFVPQLQQTSFSGSTVVARGTPPQHGSDGKVSGAFLIPQQPGTERRDGHIDFRERELLHPARANELVAQILRPTEGTAGTNVLGGPIPAKPGGRHRERLGPGVELRDDQVFARRDGVILHTTQLLDVVALHIHQGDVDLASGNLHTAGSLRIVGQVQPGAAAAAHGDLHLTGGSFDAKLTAGGTVRVDGGIQGPNSEASAGADLFCRHATSSQLRAEGLVEIADQATHCRIEATNIRMVRGRGTVLGGELHARNKIELRTAGNAQGTPTLLAVADLPAEHAALVRLEAEQSRLERTLGRQQRAAEPTGKHLRGAVRGQDRVLQERLRLRKLQAELLQHASIRILGSAHPGVTIRLGNRQRVLDLPESAHEFTLDEDRGEITRRRIS
jgi:uncharacterized protein (DUF342 family)